MNTPETLPTAVPSEASSADHEPVEPKRGTGTLVTIATYNEMENLPPLIEQVLAELPGADVLVIDDNSPDGTGRWCDEAAQRDSRISCLHREGKLGLGTAIVAGMKYAIEHDYEFVLNMDADFSHHPRYLPDLLALMQPVSDSADAARDAVQNKRRQNRAVDVAIGSRYVRGGGVQNWPLKRRLMSRAVNLYARCALGLRAKDVSGAYRCYRVSTLRKVDFDAVRSRGYSFQEEILWLVKRVGGRMAETPILFADRQLGLSKIHGGEAWAALRILFRLGIKNWLRI